VVLGFLSFMMISAVSFAVYMRIERQASSNYRHATTARHLLDAALFRAIDEIDAELRVPKVNDSSQPSAQPLKFPDWPGRVKTSAVANGEENAKDARVLSLESLSYIPAIFVNDVRRYAIAKLVDDDSPGDPNDPEDKNGSTWAGAKWRKLSMPVASIAGQQNATAQGEIGRYAYVCINVSDMLDVNLCKAAVRDAGTNRVSIGHLFADAAARKAFDDKMRNAAASSDIHYESLQDFYSCMDYRLDTTFGSPYHKFLKNGDDSYFDDAAKHVLITDSIVKAEPTRKTPAGATKGAISIVVHPPIKSAILMAARPSPESIQMDDDFQNALVLALKGRLDNAASVVNNGVTATALADYIDQDNIPKQLNMPSVEMVPMISQIAVPDFCAPTILAPRAAPVDGKPARTVTALQLVTEPNPPIYVEVVWPFKHHRGRMPQPSFKVEVMVFLKVNKTDSALTSKSFNRQPAAADGYITTTPLVGEAEINPGFWGKNTDTSVAQCYDKVTVRMTVPAAALTVDIIDSDGIIQNANCFALNQKFSVAMIVFARVKCGSDYVDSVPQFSPYPGFEGNETAEFIPTPKLFFQTEGKMVQASMGTGVVPYKWRSLEVADPRFNWKASNWIQNPEDPNNFKAGINPSTTSLLGKDGRDGDIYLSVSDIGKLQSPGELGFIVRPFPYDAAGKDATDFSSADPMKAEDAAYMFRTIRLYDHGDPSGENDKERARDRIYDWFTAQNPDGTLAGARVNPLSDLPNVLLAAVMGTPLDYYWAGPKSDVTATTSTKYVFDDNDNGMGTASWASFVTAWTKCLLNAKDKSDFNTRYKNNLSDVYGDYDYFGWYTAGQPDQIFKGGYAVAGVPANLSSPLHEIDRKMLFSYTLESFSDRQQLFLYILRAEATVPSFGNLADGGVRSLAGGRAVALVWRDPYPDGYVKPESASDSSLGTWNRQGQREWFSDQNYGRVSPWYQHNKNQYDDDKDEASRGSAGTDDVIENRLDGYHQHRILFFKQLDK